MRNVNELAITVIGHDRPGIIADVAEILAGLGMNLTDSTMTRLRGHFAMTLVCVGEPVADEVEAALSPLTSDGALLSTVRRVGSEADRPPTPHFFQLAFRGANTTGSRPATASVTSAWGLNWA